MSERVLATDAAVKAGERMQTLLTGGLLEQLNLVVSLCQTLSSPALWDGQKAATFRTGWPQTRSRLERARHSITSLQKHSSEVLAAIVTAGSSGGMGGTLAPARATAHQQSWWQKILYWPLEAASSAAYAVYYGSYESLNAINSLPLPARIVVDVVSAPLRPLAWVSEGLGLGGDISIDQQKNLLLGNGESWLDEGFVGPILGNGLKARGIDPLETYLPGVHKDGTIDWQW